MEPLPRILRSMRKVRFQDCDPFNHLNNSKYLDYFLNEREDQVFLQQGLNIFKMIEEDKLAWVVVSHQISYLIPALTMETVTIESQLITFSKKSLSVEMRMLDQTGKILKAVMWTSYVFVNLDTQQPVNHSKNLFEMFEEVILPVGTDSFQERIRDLKLQFRSKNTN